MTQAKSFGFECDALSAEEARRPVPLHRPPRASVGAAYIAERRLCRPLRADQAYAKARPRRRRPDRGRRHASPTSSRDGRRVDRRGHRPRHHRLRHPGQLRRASGPSASARWRASPLAAGVVEHQYFVTEKTLDLAAEPHHAARPGQELLSQARHRELCHRRLGGRHQGLLARPAAARLRARAVRRQLRPAGAVRAARRRSGCRSSTRSASRP